jgi:inosine-uridine nucleoside N-ribohydrolase
MRSFRFLLLSILVIAVFSGCKTMPGEQEPVKIILDTDFGPDYDDVGALAFLHAMADSGRAEILAVLSCNKHALVGPSIDVVNTYFGRPELPLGAPKGNAADMGAWQHWPDSLVKKFSHQVQSTADLPDAIEVYRKILYAQPDASVTLVTVGFLTNLAGLLRSQPDSLCPLSGKDLVSKKVKKLVSMAGWFPEGREFNVHIDSAASQFVFENWPGQIVFTGFEIGSKIYTGLNLIVSDIVNNPVKEVFRICIPMSQEDQNGRMSWDQTAVLIAVYGTQGFFSTVPGTITINPDGSNGWINSDTGKHSYVVLEKSADAMSLFIEDRMMHIPVRNNGQPIQ